MDTLSLEAFPGVQGIDARVMESLDTFFNNTTSQFYVVLTGTSSFLSGVMMFLEWLHYTYFGMSIVDRVVSAVIHIFPFLGSSKSKENDSKAKKATDAKPFRNSLMLFRGAEYYRYREQTSRKPLTDYDMSVTLQEYQTFFTNDGAKLEDDPGDLLMASVWKEPDRTQRVTMAHKVLEMNPQCAAALVLLAEEQAATIMESEELFRQALRASEVTYKHTTTLSHQDSMYKPIHERNANLCAYCKLRLAYCNRKLGKFKEAIKLYRDLLKDDHVVVMANVQENLIECLLEMQSYSEVAQFLAKQEELSLIKSTSMCYTIALLKAKAVGEKFCPETVSRRSLNSAELVAVEAIHRAVELNPHVPKYLLELKSLVLPPEHVCKRGDSEAVAYAFHHINHWKRVEGALSLLGSTWEGTFRRIPFPLERGHIFHAYPAHAESVDRQLLPDHHEVSVFPQRDTPFFMVFTGVLCFSFMTLTVVAYHFPQAMTQYAKTVTTVFLVVLEKIIPTDIFGIFSS